MDRHNPPDLQEDLLERYIKVMGVTKRQPSINALADLVSSHLTWVPFENVSKLHYRKRMALNTIPDIRTYLDGIEGYHFGGTCYSNNYYFYSLLANLGYTVRLCSADMSTPDGHMASIVHIEGREFLVDVGYAATFLSPPPRDLSTDHTIVLGHDRYVLKPQDAQGRSRLELYRDGILKYGYLVKPEPKKIEDFSIEETFRDDATFMNTLLLARFFADSSIVIHNLTVIESKRVKSKSYSLKDRDELSMAVKDHFGIPQDIVKDVVREQRYLSEAWS